MIRTLTTALALITAAGPALALSCMRPDAVRMFEFARDSADAYYVIKGRITSNGPYALPDADNPKSNSAETPVRIDGLGLSETGFSVPVNINATVHLQCLAVWCAGPPSTEELLMIVKTTGDALVLDIDPCSSSTISWSNEAEDRILQCHLSGDCQQAEF